MVVGSEVVLVVFVECVCVVGVSVVKCLVVSVLLYCVLFDELVVCLVEVFVGICLYWLCVFYLSSSWVCLVVELVVLVDDFVGNMVCCVEWLVILCSVYECGVCLYFELLLGWVFSGLVWFLFGCVMLVFEGFWVDILDVLLCEEEKRI